MAVTDYFTKYSNGSQPIPTTLSAQKLAGATTASLTTATGWDTTTVKRVRVYSTTVSGSQTVPDQATICIYDATLSGTTLSNLTLVWSASGSDQTHAAGATVDLALTASFADDLATGLLVSLDQDGTLKSGAVDVTAVVADSILTKAKLDSSMNTELNTGWVSSVLPAVSSVTYNGNRSYDITFASTVASILSSGMRLRTTRTVAAPTTCIAPSGVGQYYSKASPNKLTFTDDFVVSAWIKLSSYPTGTQTYIASRYNGTSGWTFQVQSNGTFLLAGYNAGVGNVSYIQSYQSLPLNKWVHVAGQLDMSAFTNTSTTSYLMLDGVDIPANPQRGGTNPTALVQAGNLEIAAANGGTTPFAGKIAQVAIYNAKVTQANIKLTYSQGLSGSETSLASAYSFFGTLNDLNTTTPNDLTANGGAGSGNNADSPYGSYGTSSTLDYALVQAVSTTVATVQVPEGCTIPTSGGVTSVAYSVQGNPYGWVSDKGRWKVSTLFLARQTLLLATAGTIYHMNARIDVPVGTWNVGYATTVQVTHAGTTGLQVAAALGTTSSSQLTNFLCYTPSISPVNTETDGHVLSNDDLALSSITTYYLNYTAAVNTVTAYQGSGAGNYPSKIYAIPSNL